MDFIQVGILSKTRQNSREIELYSCSSKYSSVAPLHDVSSTYIQLPYNTHGREQVRATQKLTLVPYLPQCASECHNLVPPCKRKYLVTKRSLEALFCYQYYAILAGVPFICLLTVTLITLGLTPQRFNFRDIRSKQCTMYSSLLTHIRFIDF